MNEKSNKELFLDRSIYRKEISFEARFSLSFDQEIINHFVRNINLIQNKNKLIKNITSSKKLQYHDYHQFLILLLHDTEFFSLTFEDDKYLEFSIAFNYKKVEQNFIKALQFFNYLQKNQKFSFNFELSKIPRYPHLREFFSALIPKLTERNNKIIKYNEVGSNIKIKINYEEILKDLWKYSRNQYFTQKIDVKKKLKEEKSDKEYLYQRFQKQVLMGYIVLLMFLNFLFFFIPKSRIVNLLLFMVLSSILYAVFAISLSRRKRIALGLYKNKFG